jgi:hypothetical protein
MIWLEQQAAAMTIYYFTPIYFQAAPMILHYPISWTSGIINSIQGVYDQDGNCLVWIELFSVD